MATPKPTPDEVRDEPIADDEMIGDDELDWPSSSPDKKILTGKALLESGWLVCGKIAPILAIRLNMPANYASAPASGITIRSLCRRI